MTISKKYVCNGSDLAKALGLHVSEGHFHIAGRFYKSPNDYPCAFFDKYGYVIFDSVGDLAEKATVSSGKVNLHRPISKMRAYKACANWTAWPRMAKRVASQRRLQRMLESLSYEEKQQISAYFDKV